MPNIYPDWKAPNNVKAFTTERLEGLSQGPYRSNNLAFKVGDNLEHVQANRATLKKILPAEPVWLEQTHSTICVNIDEDSLRQADAAITRKPNQVLIILTADCLPILLCNKQGTEVAAIHAGWRGLANGIIENTISNLDSNTCDLFAWVGPSICFKCFEVGFDVYDSFQKKHPFSKDYFKPFEQKWHANLAGIAEQILKNQGILNVNQANICTFENKNRLFSYRRDTQTGRMASLIWFTNELG